MQYRGRSLYPFWRIVWNLLWIAPVLLTCGVFLLVVLCAYGPSAAQRVWQEVSC